MLSGAAGKTQQQRRPEPTRADVTTGSSRNERSAACCHSSDGLTTTLGRVQRRFGADGTPGDVGRGVPAEGDLFFCSVVMSSSVPNTPMGLDNPTRHMKHPAVDPGKLWWGGVLCGGGREGGRRQMVDHFRQPIPRTPEVLHYTDNATPCPKNWKNTRGTCRYSSQWCHIDLYASKTGTVDFERNPLFPQVYCFSGALGGRGAGHEHALRP